MLIRKEGVEVHALRRRGWSLSAIARHLGRDRKTARGYLSGNRIPGERTPAELDPFEPFEACVRQRPLRRPRSQGGWPPGLYQRYP